MTLLKRFETRDNVPVRVGRGTRQGHVRERGATQAPGDRVHLLVSAAHRLVQDLGRIGELDRAVAAHVPENLLGLHRKAVVVLLHREIVAACGAPRCRSAAGAPRGRNGG